MALSPLSGNSQLSPSCSSIEATDNHPLLLLLSIHVSFSAAHARRINNEVRRGASRRQSQNESYKVIDGWMEMDVGMRLTT